MTASPTPIRLLLSRARGFNLQSLSVATNGLPAVNVGRPSKWGNPVTSNDILELERTQQSIGRPALGGTWRHHAVKFFDAWIGGEIPEMGEPPTAAKIQQALRGRNLACWCPIGEPCHADVLLAIANGPTCDEVHR